jgi:hypothetical protein
MVQQRLGDSGQRLARCISSTFGNVVALSGADGKGHCVAGPAVYNVSTPSIRPGKEGALRRNWNPFYRASVLLPQHDGEHARGLRGVAWVFAPELGCSNFSRGPLGILQPARAASFR